MRFVLALILCFYAQCAFAGSEVITLYVGYVTRVECQGRLLISAIGNDSLVRLEALPKEIGCGVLLKPLATQGETNLLLETSSNTVKAILRIVPHGRPQASDLELFMVGGSR